MAGALLKRRGQAYHPRFVGATKGFDGNHLRLTFGQRAGFIKHDGIKGAGTLQGIGIADQNTKLCGTTDP